MICKSSNSYVRENRVVPIKPVLAKIKLRPNKLSSPEIQRTQFPLTLAYAVSIHKVQGLSLSNVVISFELFKQRSFNYGQVYVALSRATTLNGIRILGKLEGNHFKADPRVHKEYERLRQISPITMQTKETLLDNASFTICLLNIRSLRKHARDIHCDSRIINSDLIALTETQLVPCSSDSDIKNDLHPFTLYRQDHPTDRFSSLAVCTRSPVQATEHQYFAQINALKFVLYNMSKQTCTVLLLYRKNNTNVHQYVECLGNILSCIPIDMIMGDFNINYFDSSTSAPLRSLMSSFGYSQAVQNPTFLSSGSALDHIYLKSTYDVIQNTIISVYYSDHDAIRLTIRHST